MQSSCFTPVWAGPRGPLHCPPSGLMTPPAGWDPPSVKTLGRSQLLDFQRHTHHLLCLWVCVFLRGWNEQTSSKNCCVRRSMCLSSVSSRKFFFSASWLVLISFSSFSSFSKVACQSQSRDAHCYGRIYERLLLQGLGIKVMSDFKEGMVGIFQSSYQHAAIRHKHWQKQQSFTVLNLGWWIVVFASLSCERFDGIFRQSKWKSI